jgi:acetyltransferase-like isoleucine patch superfamily enzyme
MIHETAIVSGHAKLGRNVVIGPYSIVHPETIIGDSTEIGSNCEIGCPTPSADGEPLVLGASSLIRSHSVLYQGSTFGANLVTGHRVTIREKTKAGANLQVGTLGDIQGHCVIGDYVRFHSNVHIGQHSWVGNFVWIFPYVVLTNDPHPPSSVMMGVRVEDFAAIATSSVVLPGVTIGAGALVAAQSSVSKNVEPGKVVGGVPAKIICDASDILLKDGSNMSAYPWRRHFHRGYPANVVSDWEKEFE